MPCEIKVHGMACRNQNSQQWYRDDGFLVCGIHASPGWSFPSKRFKAARLEMGIVGEPW